ncbi:F0F1 ATP synthase subunit B [Candidatus Gottesmanbacteria bacterium]|nr:F0F1 ATP synthase subunit B [Candidatus Gottesmanbacteria bacterium]
MDKLGIEPTLLGAQVINFLVILIVLQKLLYKPILTMLEKRKREIAEGVELTAKMREAEEKLKLSHEKALGKAREDALAIIEEAKKQAKETEKELVVEAHQQAEAIIARAKAEAEETKLAAKAAISREAVELAVVMAKRVLASVMGAKEQHALIAKRVKDLESWGVREEKKSA